jgi:3-keto-5-aminohexanoate cleavage enzyme
MSSLEEKVVILVAPNGERIPGEGGIYVPITPKEIAEEAYRCYQAGASIVHVHGRNEKTTYLSGDINVYNETFRLIKEKCDMLIEMTGVNGLLHDPVTNQWVPFSDEGRMDLLQNTDPRPDMIPTTVGIGELQGPGASAQSGVFASTRDFLKKFIPAAIKRKIHLEFEIWDTSMLWNTLRLAEEGVFDKDMPFVFNYCSGDRNGVQASTPRQMVHVWEEGQRLFPNASWYATARASNYFQILVMAMVFGCTIVRIGAEDNTTLPDGTVAKDSVQLVETAVRIARDLGREVATVEEAREILGIPKE